MEENNIIDIQKGLTNMVKGTILTPDGKPNAKGIDGIGDVLREVINQRQNEIGKGLGDNVKPAKGDMGAPSL